MTATIHRWLMFIGGFSSGLGGIWSLSDAQILGIPPSVGAVCSVISAIAILAANQMRIAWPTNTPGA